MNTEEPKKQEARVEDEGQSPDTTIEPYSKKVTKQQRLIALKKIRENQAKSGYIYIFYYLEQAGKHLYQIGYMKQDTFYSHGQSISKMNKKIIAYAAKISCSDQELLEFYVQQYFHHYRRVRQALQKKGDRQEVIKQRKWYDFSQIQNIDYVIDVIYKLRCYRLRDQNEHLRSPVANVYQAMKAQLPQVQVQPLQQLRTDQPSPVNKEQIQKQKQVRNMQCQRVNYYINKKFETLNQSIDSENRTPNLITTMTRQNLNNTSTTPIRENIAGNVRSNRTLIVDQSQSSSFSQLSQISQCDGLIDLNPQYVMRFKDHQDYKNSMEKQRQKILNTYPPIAGQLYIYIYPRQADKKRFKIGGGKEAWERLYNWAGQSGEQIICIGKVASCDWRLHESYVHQYFQNYRFIRRKDSNFYRTREDTRTTKDRIQWFDFKQIKDIQYVIDVMFQMTLYQNRNKDINPIYSVYSQLKNRYEKNNKRQNIMIPSRFFIEKAIRNDKKSFTQDQRKKILRKSLKQCRQINMEVHEYMQKVKLSVGKKLRTANDLIPDMVIQNYVYDEWRYPVGQNHQVAKARRLAEKRKRKQKQYAEKRLRNGGESSHQVTPSRRVRQSNQYFS